MLRLHLLQIGQHRGLIAQHTQDPLVVDPRHHGLVGAPLIDQGGRNRRQLRRGLPWAGVVIVVTY